MFFTVTVRSMIVSLGQIFTCGFFGLKDNKTFKAFDTYCQKECTNL